MLTHRRTHRPSPGLPLRRMLLLLAFASLVLVGALAQPVVHASMQPLYQPSPLPGASPSPGLPSPSPTPTPTSTGVRENPSPEAPGPTPTPELQPSQAPILPFSPLSEGLVVAAIQEGGYSHLFAYQPHSQPLTRLTDGAWDDITPALSPDGRWLAFASNRSGAWDLYRMELSSGEISRLTEDPAYEGAPSWSPDSQWLAYETYTGQGDSQNLEILVRPVQGGQDPIPLTEDPAADYAPAWSPQGRKIAFISDRSGEPEVWLADLDRMEDRFQNLSRSRAGSEAHPQWSPDGSRLAWASTSAGLQNLYVWDAQQPEASPRSPGSGDWPAWSPSGEMLLAFVTAPNQAYLTAYDLRAPGLALPAVSLPGTVAGLAWGQNALPASLPPALAQAARATPTPPWQPALIVNPRLPGGRMRLVPLPAVNAPQPLLQDLIDESFNALRQRVIADAGWDFLASLENASVPLTALPGPEMDEDWLYTGRAFAFNLQPLNAGWLVVAREDFGPQTYWRVYLRALLQDGSQGAPLHARTWDFSARYGEDPRFYETGGALSASAPPGYWIDFTALAAAYGWQRLAALPSWITNYPAAQFNKFVHADGLDWRSAMLEIYPLEALSTPTPAPPPTSTPAATLAPTNTPPPTRTPTPTRTPRPAQSPASASAPQATSSPAPAPSATPRLPYDRP